jgi:cobalt-zinc-cadmium resistance protein CzcA
LFYAVAVIVASFLPIYVLAGPSGTLFKPMADTMVFALVGSLIVTLTLLPVLCSWFMRQGVRERRNAALKRSNQFTPRASIFVSRIRGGRRLPRPFCWRFAAAHSPHRRRVHAATGRRRTVGARHDALHHLLRRIGEDHAPDPGVLKSFPEVTTVASELAGLTTARIPPAFSTSSFTSA